MGTIVYCLKERIKSGELRLFEATPNTNGCVPHKSSICKKMSLAETENMIFSCLDENNARLECAKQGRKVCGTCVSSLYATY